MVKKPDHIQFPSNGIKRVIIRQVLPAAACGQYPAKAVAGFPLRFSAVIFTDGIDKIIARLQYRFLAEKEWRYLPLEPQVNDSWAVSMIPDQTGMLEFRVKAWISELAGWADSFRKKQDAGADTSVEAQTGKALLQELVKVSQKKDKEQLKALLSGTKEEGITPADIEETLFERLIELQPTGKVSTSAVYTVRIERKKAQFSTWYELFPRSCAPKPGTHGTFRDVAEQLPRLSEAGFDVLYLPPIHPIGQEKRKGKNNSLEAQAGEPGSPWAIGSKEGGHKSLHPELGDRDDFQHLLVQAKSYKMEIAMDIALQCAPDHPYVTEHPEWFKWRPDGTVQYAENPPKKYEDILPFDFDSDAWKTLWEELFSIFRFWAGEGVRIFRVDNPHTKSLQMWEWLVDRLLQEYPDVILLSEAFTRPNIMEHLAMIGFSQSYTYFTWRETKAELEAYVTELTKGDKQFFFRPNFWPNTPDILPAHLVKGGENNHVIRLLLAATLSSSYGIYGPVYELGITDSAKEKEEYSDNEKYEIKFWEQRPETRIWKVIKQVNHIRHSYTALQETNNISFLPTSNDRLMAYVKWDRSGSEHLLVVVNLDPFNTQSGWVNIPYDRLLAHYKSPLMVQDLLQEGTYDWNKDWNYAELDPGERPAHIFRFIVSQ